MSAEASEDSSLTSLSTTAQKQDKNDGNAEEKRRLAGRAPLKTMLILMIGPIISQVTGALSGIVNSIWISKVLGETGLAAVGLEMSFEVMARAFGYFMMISASTKISQLFGKNLQDDAGQVACDIMRWSLICGVLVPAILLPIHDPILKWYGASSQTSKMGFQYLLPIVALNFFTCLNLGLQGVLQAEGRTLLIGIIDLVSLTISAGALSPLFLYVFKMGMPATALATVLADAVPGVILTFCYFHGRFGVKPKWRQLCKPFSRHIWPALGVGVSQLFANLAMAIPSIPVRELLRRTVASEQEYDYAMSGFTIAARFINLEIAVNVAFATGYLAAASYANAAELYDRFLWLTWHVLWLTFVWGALMSTVAIVIPTEICKLFGSGEGLMLYGPSMLKEGSYLGYLMFIRFCIQAMLQALQRGGRAMIVSLTGNFAGTLIGQFALFYLAKNPTPGLLMWSWGVSYVFSLVIGVPLVIGPVIGLFKARKAQRQDLSPIECEEKKLSDTEAKEEDPEARGSSSTSTEKNEEGEKMKSEQEDSQKGEVEKSEQGEEEKQNSDAVTKGTEEEEKEESSSSTEEETEEVQKSTSSSSSDVSYSDSESS